MGVTEEAEVGAVVGQGTIGGALVSQAVLDEGVMEHFTPGEEEEVQYGGTPMAPMMFMDDLIHGSKGTKEARRASSKVNLIMKARALQLNEEKSTYMVMGNKRQREQIRKELEAEPMVCGGFVMKERSTEKWLGQQLSEMGLAESVAATVASKEAKIKGACLEIATIVNDWRAEAVGGMETALILWERCCIPSLLHGAGTWTNISAATTKKLNSLQQWFLRLVLQVGPGAPLGALGWETGVMDMGLRVKKEKLMMALHLRQLGEQTLARMIYEEQVSRGWPGLAKEVIEICAELGIENANTTKLTKGEYKDLINKACITENEKILRKLAQNKKKCLYMLKENYGKKSYIEKEKISDVRQHFKTRTGMLPFACNFSADRKYAKTGWLCRCGEPETMDHIKEACLIYSDIRAEFNSLSEDEDLVTYLARVLDRREQIDSLDKEEEEEEERAKVTPEDVPSVPASPRTGQSSNVC